MLAKTMSKSNTRLEIDVVAHKKIAPRDRIKRISASQQIHDALRDRIISMELAPGQNLSRIEISDYYGVSQTPVREAMQRLEEEGLLLIYPQSKTEVSPIDISHAFETQFLRLSIEVEVTRRLSQMKNPSLLEPAKYLLGQQIMAREAGNIAAFSNLDRQFHQSLYAAVGVENLWDLIASRSGHIDRLRNLNLPDPGKSEEILHSHRLILEKIADGQVDEAVEAVRVHLSGTLAMAEEIKMRCPTYF